MSLFNLAKMTTSTTGTGTITLDAASVGFLSFASAGVTNGVTVTYAIEDGSSREIGRGVYTSATKALTRTVLNSTNANAAISLSGSAVVFITLAAEDLSDMQPLDATLTALAALTIAADSLTIGTGADAFSQTTFAANTFPAKASTGALVAKTITDFGLSLIDDAAASNARTTLGLGTSAVIDTGTSGTKVPLLDGANTWSSAQIFSGLIQLAGATSSFPALKRNGANIDIRLADDSGYTGITASNLVATAAAITTSITASTFNKLTLTTPATGATLTIPDGLTLNAGPGGTLTSAAFTSIGTSGATIPLLSTANTWTLSQTFSAAALFASGTKTAPSIAFSGETNMGFFTRAADLISVALGNGKSCFEILGNAYGVNEGLRIANGFALGASNTDFSTAGPDVYILREASDVLAQQRTTAAQTTRIYRTFTDASNYERQALQSGSGYFEWAAETAGTGTDDIDLRITPAGVGVPDFRNTQNGAGVQVATLTNGHAAGNPAYWMKIKYNAGTVGYIPIWA